MSTSIQHFNDFGIKRIEKVSDEYHSDLTKIAEYIEGITSVVVDFGLSLIAEEWNSIDDILHERRDLRSEWQVVRTDDTTLGTSLGEVKYHKTLFKNKFTGERKYLLDELMGIESHARMTEDAVARILEEAVDSSYKKGGIQASISNFTVTKQTTMNKIHQLQFPKIEALENERKVKCLYIDADEDHVSLQYLHEKGDIADSMSNTYMPKIVYVYEDIVADGDRHRLKNVKYFGGGYDGTQGTRQLWDEVFEYIKKSYDSDVLERIYINGDGASWIKSGANIHAKAIFVLDKFHLHKYILAATSHLMDSKEDARIEIWQGIKRKSKKSVKSTFEHILYLTESESRQVAVEKAQTYILSNWPAIMNGIKNETENLHCSAEGHVSHIYADRMSSRPLGWSRIGADKMSRLRVYQFNGGDMLELVRFQKEDIPKAAGAESIGISAAEVMVSINKNKQALGIVADLPWYNIPYPQIRKIAAIKNHIYGL
jgi:hypothetical protein